MPRDQDEQEPQEAGPDYGIDPSIQGRLQGPRQGRRVSWGIRIGVGPFREMTGLIHQRGHATFEELVADYESRHGVNRGGKPKLSTVRSILQTMTHLGLLTLSGRNYRLSESGKRYASAIDSPKEAAELSTVLLHYPEFRSLWLRIQSQASIRHSEISDLFAQEFFYARRPAANFSAFFLSFATRGGFLRKNAGSHTYEVVGAPDVASEGTTISARSEVRQPRTRVSRSPAPIKEAEGRAVEDHDLKDVARRLGLALADPHWRAQTEDGAHLVEVLQQMRTRLHGGGPSRIQKVAIELALQGLTRTDDRALSWSVQCFNGLIETGWP